MDDPNFNFDTQNVDIHSADNLIQNTNEASGGISIETNKTIRWVTFWFHVFDFLNRNISIIFAFVVFVMLFKFAKSIINEGSKDIIDHLFSFMGIIIGFLCGRKVEK